MEIQLGIATEEKLPEHPFWDFSLQLYHNDIVARSLLMLQNNFSLNANLILYFCWHAYNGQGSLNLTRVRDILLRIRPWHERIVMPLRRIRERLKPHVDTVLWVKNVRQAVFLEELEAEHAEQLLIAESGVFDPKTEKTTLQQCADICRSMVAYCRVMRTDLDSQACEAVAAILSVMYSQVPESSILKLCRKRLQHKRRREGTSGTQLWLDI